MPECFEVPDVDLLKVPDTCSIQVNHQRTRRGYIIANAIVAAAAWVLEQYEFEVPELRRVDYGQVVVSPDCCEQIAVGIQPAEAVGRTCSRTYQRTFRLVVSGCRPNTVARRDDPQVEADAAFWLSMVEEALSRHLGDVLAATLAGSTVAGPCDSISVSSPVTRKQKCLGLQIDLTIS